jgi:hypothetical protein
MKTKDINKLFQNSIPNGETPVTRKLYVGVRARYNPVTELFEAAHPGESPGPSAGDYQFPVVICLQVSKDGILQLGIPGNLIQGISAMDEVVPL